MARMPKGYPYKSHEEKIRWLLNNKDLNNRKNLARTMKKAGLYSPTTALVDIESYLRKFK